MTEWQVHWSERVVPRAEGSVLEIGRCSDAVLVEVAAEVPVLLVDHLLVVVRGMVELDNLQV